MMSKTMKRTIGLALGLAMLLGLTGCSAASGGSSAAPAAPAPAASASASTEGVTVSGSGTIRLAPDMASVTFGVMTQEASAEEAQNKNTEAVNHVIEVLTGLGVEEKSIRTTYYSMYPQYDWSDGEEQRITGYNVTTSMTVQDQKLEDVGEILSACVEAGINNVDNVSFFCSSYDEAYKQALEQAVAASRDKAEALAAAAGKKLGEPVVISEGWHDTSARYGQAVNMSAAYDMEEAKGGGPSLQPGETEITANVTVTYEMK